MVWEGLEHLNLPNLSCRLAQGFALRKQILANADSDRMLVRRTS